MRVRPLRMFGRRVESGGVTGMHRMYRIGVEDWWAVGFFTLTLTLSHRGRGDSYGGSTGSAWWLDRLAMSGGVWWFGAGSPFGVAGWAVGCWVGGWLAVFAGLVVCWFGGLAGGRVGIVVSARPGWARNYLTYFSVYSARLVRACARARTVPGTPVGRMPLRSEVFERRLPPGRLRFLLTGLAVDAWVLPPWGR